MVSLSAGAVGAKAEEPPWSRPPAWLTTPEAPRPLTPEMGMIGRGEAPAALATPRPEVATSPVFWDGSGGSAPAVSAPAVSVVPPSAPAAQVPVWQPPAVQTASAVSAATTAMASVPTAAPQPPAKPLWEVGVIGGGAFTPDYPAADQNHGHALAVPMLRYRGEFFRSDERGVRGRFLHTDRVELDLSANASFPADSKDNDARKGMPDLDWMGEIGPRVQVSLYKDPQNGKIDAELPVRAVFSTDFHSDVTYRGWVVQPELAYSSADLWHSGASVKAGISGIFGSRDLNETFYEVAPAYATVDRPAYAAKSGYMGSQLDLRTIYPVTPWVSLAAMGRVGFHQGAANEDSPLFRDDVTYSAGLGMILTLAKSKTSAQ